MYKRQEFVDGERNMDWVFSHDRLRFVGHGNLDRRARGELGVGVGQAAFPDATMPFAASYLYNARAVYQYDDAEGRVFERIRLPQGEVVASPPEPAGDNLLLLSDRAAYFLSLIHI